MLSLVPSGHPHYKFLQKILSLLELKHQIILKYFFFFLFINRKMCLFDFKKNVGIKEVN